MADKNATDTVEEFSGQEEQVMDTLLAEANEDKVVEPTVNFMGKLADAIAVIEAPEELINGIAYLTNLLHGHLEKSNADIKLDDTFNAIYKHIEAAEVNFTDDTVKAVEDATELTPAFSAIGNKIILTSRGNTGMIIVDLQKQEISLGIEGIEKGIVVNAVDLLEDAIHDIYNSLSTLPDLAFVSSDRVTNEPDVTPTVSDNAVSDGDNDTDAIAGEDGPPTETK